MNSVREPAKLSIEKFTGFGVPPTISISKSFGVIYEAIWIETSANFELILIVTKESRVALTMLIDAMIWLVLFWVLAEDWLKV